MSVPVSPHCSSSNQELGTPAALCVALPSILNNQLEVSLGGKRLVGELICFRRVPKAVCLAI